MAHAEAAGECMSLGKDTTGTLGDESASKELRRRRQFELVVHLLHLFKGLDAAVVEELVPQVEWLSLRSGETLFRQGDAADATFFLISGRLRVVAEESSGARVLNEIG
ncbi:MAG: cyclic nucleotide-binding domain-containing protein, partial [Planctomycetota bacterium]